MSLDFFHYILIKVFRAFLDFVLCVFAPLLWNGINWLLQQEPDTQPIRCSTFPSLGLGFIQVQLFPKQIARSASNPNELVM